MKGLKMASKSSDKLEEEVKEIRDKFITETIKRHPEIEEEELEELFNEMSGGYLFNKGHGVGYTILSCQEMYYKIYYPLEFWAAKIKQEKDELKRRAYEAEAVKAGLVILPAHINGPAECEIVEFGGGKCIQRGINSIKGVGDKAGAEIDSHGPYIDKADLQEQCEKRKVNAKVMKALDAAGALIFDNKELIKFITRENKSLKGTNINIR